MTELEIERETLILPDERMVDLVTFVSDCSCQRRMVVILVGSGAELFDSGWRTNYSVAFDAFYAWLQGLVAASKEPIKAKKRLADLFNHGGSK
jgi:hypothetical protein